MVDLQKVLYTLTERLEFTCKMRCREDPKNPTISFSLSFSLPLNESGYPHVLEEIPLQLDNVYTYSEYRMVWDNIRIKLIEVLSSELISF